MYLVVDQMVQLEHVHDAHGHVLVERLTATPIEEHRLAALLHTREPQKLLDLFLTGAVEDRGGQLKTVLPALGHLRDLAVW